MSKIYVAGKWEDREEVKLLQTELIALGHEITCDWTIHELPEKEKYAIEDVEGVKACDGLIALMIYDYQYKGSIAEIGMAIALDKPVLVIGAMFDSSIFANHPLVFIYYEIGNFEKIQMFLKMLETKNE